MEPDGLPTVCVVACSFSVHYPTKQGREKLSPTAVERSLSDGARSESNERFSHAYAFPSEPRT
jgi:hypothetical protein